MYKKLRFTIRFVQAVISKYRFYLLITIAASTVLYFLIPKLYTKMPHIRTTKHIAMIGKYTLRNLPQNIQHQLSIGLTTIDLSGLPAAGAAASWEATDSGKTYLFHLNPNIKWQDGKPLKSSDIKYNFKDISVDYPNEKTLAIHLQDSYSPLPILVSQPLFRSTISKNIFKTQSLVGLGSYTISSYKKNGDILDSLSLSPVDRTLRLPFIKYYFYSTSTQAKQAFKLGLVESISGLQNPDELSQWPNAGIDSQISYDRHVAIFFNTEDPFLSGAAGKNLRLALTYAVDKSRWENRALGPIPPNSWAYSKDLKRYDQDLEKAVSLLSKVEQLPSDITLTTVPTYLQTAEEVKLDWEKLNLNVTIKVLPDIPSEFQALLIAQSIPQDPDQYNLWHSTRQSTNLTQLKNPRIDKLLEDGRKTTSIDARKLIYQDFQRYLLEEVPAIFLYYPLDYTISRH